nr:PREDICTED: uncharacterized protein LOC109034850 [Bemisia tabaci]
MHISCIFAVAISVLLTINFPGADGGEPFKAKIFGKFNFKSKLEYLEGDSCKDLAPANREKASAIEPYDTCVIMWSEPGCTGLSKQVRKDTANRENLKLLNFDNILSSVGPCPKLCC